MAPKRRYLSYLRDRWWVLLLCLLLTVLPTLVYDTVRSDAYESYAQLYVTGDIQIAQANVFGEDRNFLGSQVELLKSPRLQGEAAAKAWQGSGLRPPKVKVEVTEPLNTSLLVLHATGADPAYTRNFLIALIEAYRNYQHETRKSTAEELVASLTQELSTREASLKRAQQDFVNFQRTNNLAVIQEESKNTALSLANMEQQLQEVTFKRDLLQNGLSESPGASLTQKSDATNGPAQVSNSPSAMDAELKAQKVRLSQELTVLAAAPNTNLDAIINKGLKQEIETTRQAIATLERLDQQQRELDLEQCQKQISILSNTIPQVKKRVLEIDDRLSQSIQYKNDIEREQAYYDHLLGLLQNVDMSQTVSPDRTSVLQAPTASLPVPRLLPLLLAVAGVLGLALGAGLVFVWHIWDDRFSSIYDVKDQFGEMVLGLVPEIKVPRARPQEALLKDADPRYAYVESFRHLRSALLLSPGGEGRQQVLLVTGVAPGEGKSTVAFNLARTLARSGLRIVLVDADARGAGLHRLLDHQEGPGLFDCLRGEATLENVLRPTSVNGFSYVSRGLPREDLDGYFLRPEFAEFMAGLRKDRDFVILDGPPILAADDAALLVPQADSVLLVVRPFFTRARLLRQAMEMLYQRQAKDVSIIFNRARRDDLAGKYLWADAPKSRKNGSVKLRGKNRGGNIDPTLPPPADPTITQSS